MRSIFLAAVFLSAAAAPARAMPAPLCGGHVSEIAGVVVETGAVEARIEVRVRDIAGGPLAASGSVSTVIGANPMRLSLAPMSGNVLAAIAPAIPPEGDFAIVHLRLADDRSLKIRTPLNQIGAGCLR